MNITPIIAMLTALGIAACSQNSAGSAEKVGEKADTAIEQATGGTKDLTDGPMENAGEVADKVAADAGEQARDAKAAADKTAMDKAALDQAVADAKAKAATK